MAGVVLPQPCGGVGIVLELIEQIQRRALLVDGQRRGAGGIYADTDDLRRVKVGAGVFGLSQGLGDRRLNALEIIGGVLPCQVVVG
jgi:hypothetical protein